MTRRARAYRETLASPGYSQANTCPGENSHGGINCFSAVREPPVRAWQLGARRPRTLELDPADALSAIHEEMKQLANAINAASVTSIDGLRAKALVAFWAVAPLCAGDTEFSFEDAYPFQQLFTAVAELCGLKDKMVATGYELPDIAMVDDDSDDDSDDEGEEA